MDRPFSRPDDPNEPDRPDEAREPSRPLDRHPPGHEDPRGSWYDVELDDTSDHDAQRPAPGRSSDNPTDSDTEHEQTPEPTGDHPTALHREPAAHRHADQPAETPANTDTGDDTVADAPVRGWRTVAEEIGEVRAYRSFRAAKAHLGVEPGQEIHHIVEQAQAKPERSGFSTERVNTTDNLTKIDSEVHQRISRFYSSKPPGATETVRDTLNGESWEDQYQYGVRALDRATKGDL